MKKLLIFFFLFFFIFFLPDQAKAEAGTCICEPNYDTESECRGDTCCDTWKRVCETNCGGGCTSWKKTRNRWQECDPPEEEGGEPDCHCERNNICSIRYEREYNCTDDCDGRLQERICGTEEGCDIGCTNWVDVREGFEWQKCEISPPGFHCDGECIEAPTGLQEYEDPNSQRAAGSPAKLPVKLDWDDVPGWRGGWSGGGGGSAAGDYADCQKEYIDDCWDEARRLFEEYKETHPDAKWCQGEWTDEYLDCLRRETAENCQDILGEEECKEECPPEEECYDPNEFIRSYKITITGDLRSCADGSSIGNYEEVLGVSEFFAPCHCFFKSDRSYTWTVRACCGEDGSECGPPSSSSFTTSPAPELISPEDPDWADSGRAELSWQPPTEDDPYPVHLEWCPVEEAESYCIRMYEEGTPFCPTLFSELFCPAIIPPDSDLPIQTYFDFGLDVFTKETNYQWKVSTCLGDEIGLQCGSGCPEDEICYLLETLETDDPGCCDFSQLWRFLGHVTLLAPELIFPEDNGCVNLNHEFKWTHIPGANSYRYEIYLMDGGPILLINEPIRAEHIPVRDLWDSGMLNIDEGYGWRIRPCWDENGLSCEDDSWSNGGELWEFRTTGKEPTDPKPNGAVDVLIPIELNWDEMACAASYRYEVIAPDGSTVFEGLITGSGITPSEISITYNSDIGHPKQKTNYSWEVSTCADTEGAACGSPASANFETFELDEPINPHPCDTCDFYTDEHYLRWDSVLGAAFYRYTLDGEETIVPSNSAFIDTAILDLGIHNWSVQACIDKDCQEAGPPSINWSFELVEAEAPAGTGGIVPCGKYTDNPDTPWSEREHCGIQHVFIMIFSIINFLLWRVIPIVLVLLALASGVMFYFAGQLGIAHPPSQVKSLWKAAGIGLAVIFLAWIGISLILGLLGYQVGVFGDWWKIGPF